MAGKFTYAASCAGCHGQEGQGGVGPALTDADGPKSWTLDQFTATLREGRTPERELSLAMPRFSKEQLTDSDVTNIYRHIKTLN
ncbi:c-type cytochrome [Deinococcus malanensis]|uniref:c-type cytochrome n=1 Tax=Deinococcus malanensis TaxID=1706855 RepID=UPI003641836C